MAALDVANSALRVRMRACIVTSANQAALLSAYPHGGTELGEIAGAEIRIHDQAYVPIAWETGQPVDHGYRHSQAWVLSFRLRQFQDADWRALLFRTTTPTDRYAPSNGTIRSHTPGLFNAAGMLLFSPVNRRHDAVLAYSPVPGAPAGFPIRGDRSQEAPVLFTLGRNETMGEPVAVDRLAHLVLDTASPFVPPPPPYVPTPWVVAPAGSLAIPAADGTTYSNAGAAGLVALTLPPGGNNGDTVSVLVMTAQPLRVLPTAGQTISMGGLTTSVGGYIQASVPISSAVIRRSSPTSWAVIASQGTWGVI